MSNDPEDTSRPVELSRYRRGRSAEVVRGTELTTSLTGWILGSRHPAEPGPRTGRVVVLLVGALAALIAAAAGGAWVAYLWIGSR